MNIVGDITGVILAGGKSSRMGRDKALLELDGTPFIQHIADVLSQVFEQVVIVSDHDDRYRFLGLPIYEDVLKNCGPLGGMHAAFSKTQAEKIFVTTCDMPLLSADTIRKILGYPQQVDAVVLGSASEMQPLCGLYSRSCVPILERQLRRGQYSVLGLLENISTLVVSPATHRRGELFNVNTPQDYMELSANSAVAQTTD